MIPILFEHNATTFTSHGLGDLVEAISCATKMADTNEFELEMQYPMNGRLFNQLKVNRIIYARVANGDNMSFTVVPHIIPFQAFRIYALEKEMAGYVTVRAQHISYDLADVYVMNTGSGESGYYGTPAPHFRSTNPESILTLIRNKRISGTNNFTLSTDGAYTNTPSYEPVTAESPRSARSLLFDSSNSLIANYGGICCFNSFNIKFYATVPDIIAATIEYGDELVDFSQEQNISEMYTAILPYSIGRDWAYFNDDSYNGDDSIVYGSIINAPGTFDRQRIMPVDLTEYFNVDKNNPTDDKWSNLNYISFGGKNIYVPDINGVAARYVKNTDFGIPEINITLDYAHSNINVNLYDQVRIRFVKLGIETVSRVASVTYDVLNERNREIEIGRSKSSMWKYSNEEYSGKKKW